MPLLELMEKIRLFVMASRTFKTDHEFSRAREDLKVWLSRQPNGPQIVALIDWEN